MKPIGKALNTLCLLTLILASPASQAAVTASLDRDRVALGDTLRLTITADSGEDLSIISLRPLESNFELLQQSTSSNTRIVNGRRTDTHQLLLDITPRREGTLQIPPMRLGQHVTTMLLVSVGPPPASDTAGQTVLFEAELDRDSVYVQGQVILTLRVQQGINLEDRSITDLQMDDAFVRRLEQKSYQRTIGGRPWLVHEVRYAISPEKSGTLEIPAMTFAGREIQQRRSFFDLSGGGPQLRRSTQPLSVEVLPRPESFPAGTWLPARNLTLQENWSTSPEQLRAGESATRTINIQAEGLQGAQLPPVLFPSVDGLKYYPDQPVINDTETSTGLVGSRQDSAALVPTRAGMLQIPEIRVPWWDTESEQLRYAVLPAREINVTPAEPSFGGAAVSAAAPAIEIGSGPAAPAVLAPGDTLPWQILSAISSLGWLLTLAYLVWARRSRPSQGLATQENAGEKQAYRQLLKACNDNNPVQARRGLIHWVAALYADSTVVSLGQVATLLDDAALGAELAGLNAALYRDSAGNWQGAALAGQVKRLHSQRLANARAVEPSLELYPKAA